MEAALLREETGEQFLGLAREVPPAASPELDRLREKGRAAFARLGLPGPKDEDWKFTPIARLDNVSFGLPGFASGSVSPAILDSLTFGAARGRLVFLNGRYQPALSLPPKGVRLQSLAAALAQSPGLVLPSLGRYARVDEEPFAALNSAMFEDGAFVEIAAGAVPAPLDLIFLSDNSAGAAIVSPRNLILARPGSSAVIVETYAGADDCSYFTNAVTEVVLEEGARVEHYRLQREGSGAFHVGTLEVRQERDSRFTSHAISLGGLMARTNINVLFAGEGGECILNGLFTGNGHQHTDTHTRIDHAVPHCASREFYKGILDGSARGVFFGKIVVAPGAQKTDARQTNKNLLLSKEALVSSTPQLEIYADDVKCAHGSAIGQMDDDSLFYLRSRGLSELEARGLLTRGFVNDVLERMSVEEIRRNLSEILMARLSKETGP